MLCFRPLDEEHSNAIESDRERFNLNTSLLILEDRDLGYLMQLRSADARIMPSTIGFFGGGIEQNESPEEAAVRELSEELSLNGSLRYVGKRIAKIEEGIVERAYFFHLDVTGNKEIEVKEGDGSIYIDPLEPDAVMPITDRDMAVLGRFRATNSIH